MNPTPKRPISHLFIFLTCLLASLHQADTPLPPSCISEHACGITGADQQCWLEAAFDDVLKNISYI